MIPDKIYLNRIHPEPYWFKDKQLDYDVEYISKNALIELIEEQLAILDKQTLLHPDDDVFRGQRNAYKQMKDKLNSL